MPGVRGKPWVTMLHSSVSFLAGHDEVGKLARPLFVNLSQVLSVMVPLADGESEEEELLPSRRASIRFGFVFLPFYIICFTCSICFTCKQGNHTCFICLNFAVFFTPVFDGSQFFSNGFQHLIFNLSSLQGSASCIIQDEEPSEHSQAQKIMSKVFFHVIDRCTQKGQ